MKPKKQKYDETAEQLASLLPAGPKTPLTKKMLNQLLNAIVADQS